MDMCANGCGVPVIFCAGETLHEPPGRGDVYRDCDMVESLAYAIHVALEGHRGIAYMPGMHAEVARIAASAVHERMESIADMVATRVVDTLSTVLLGPIAGTQPTFAHGGPIAKGTLTQAGQA